MGFIRYEVYADAADRSVPKTEPIQSFVKGWAIWVDLQHFGKTAVRTVTLCWNPFVDKKSGKVLNALDEQDHIKNDTETYFMTILERLRSDLSETVAARILEYEEVLSYLASAYSGEATVMQMYSPPLYLDAVLSRDVEFKIFGAESSKKNALAINGREVTVVTPLGSPSMPIMGILCNAFRDFDYRLVKRFLFWDGDGAEKEMDAYMKKWCRGRSSVKEYMKKGLLRQFNGIYTNTFIFRFSEDERSEREAYIKSVLETLKLPHVFEDFNRKQCWWGTIPGCFRANKVAPIKGISQLGDLLILEDSNV